MPPPSWCFLPVRGRCPRCGQEFEAEGVIDVPPAACPACGGVDIELTGGDELVLESIEYAARWPHRLRPIRPDRPERSEAAMCLGIPGQVVELVEAHEHLAKVDVAGVRRTINIGLLEDEGIVPGDWVLIHVGFAMSKIDEEEAQLALEGLQLMGQAYEDEVDAV